MIFLTIKAENDFSIRKRIMFQLIANLDFMNDV